MSLDVLFTTSNWNATQIPVSCSLFPFRRCEIKMETLQLHLPEPQLTKTAMSLAWVMIPAVPQMRGEGRVVEKDLIMIFLSPTKRGRPWKPLGIVGAAVGFGKRPRIGVVLSCLLWSTCICMAGQKTKLTVERVRKKGPAPAWLVGFCSRPKFAPPSELHMGLSEWRRTGRGGRDAVEGFMVCASKMSIWDLIMGLILKHTFLKLLVNLCQWVELFSVFSCQYFQMLSRNLISLLIWIHNWSGVSPHIKWSRSLKCKSLFSAESDSRLMSEQQTDELRGLACHTANLKVEVVKGIIQRSKFNPKLAKHAQCAALHCFRSQSIQKNQKGAINTSYILWKNHYYLQCCVFSKYTFCSLGNLFIWDPLEDGHRKSLCCCRAAAVCSVMYQILDTLKCKLDGRKTHWRKHPRSSLWVYNITPFKTTTWKIKQKVFYILKSYTRLDIFVVDKLFSLHLSLYAKLS